MTRLTAAIVSHDLTGMEKVVAEDPHLLRESVAGWLPIEWARRSGNIVTFVRFLRCVGEGASEEGFPSLLRGYLELLSGDEYEPCSLAEGASMAWDAAYLGKIHKHGRWKRDFVSSPQQAEDLRFLIERCGMRSKEALINEFKQA